MSNRVRRVDRGTRQAVTDLSKVWERKSYRTSPKDTGKLARSIQGEGGSVGGDREFGASIRVGEDYGRYLMYGTKYIADGDVLKWKMGDRPIANPGDGGGQLPIVRIHAKQIQSQLLNRLRRIVV